MNCLFYPSPAAAQRLLPQGESCGSCGKIFRTAFTSPLEGEFDKPTQDGGLSGEGYNQESSALHHGA